MVGIKGLAQHLNISIGTVSRALNDRPDVNKETRARVIEAAERLGYSPNQSGRSLRRGSTGIIAAMIPTSDDTPLSDTIFTSVLDGLRAELAHSNLDLVILLSGGSESRIGFLKRVVERGLSDGIIISDIYRHDERIGYLQKRQIPFVAFGRTETQSNYAWLDLDCEAITHKAVERFAELGRKRIALGTLASELNYGVVMEKTFREALAANGLECFEDLIVRTRGSEAGGYELGETLLSLEAPPDAVVLIDESMTHGLYRRLSEANLLPGHDISIIGSVGRTDGRFFSPRLTCFRTDLKGLGAELGRSLVTQLPTFKGTAPTKLVQKRWPVEFVPGESDRSSWTAEELSLETIQRNRRPIDM